MKWHSPNKNKCKKRKKQIKVNIKALKKIKLSLNNRRKLKKHPIFKRDLRKSQILYIIGNGFDLHHGMATKYSDFRYFLKHEYPNLLEEISKYYDTSNRSKLWKDFENELKNFDPNALEENFIDFLPDIGSDDFRDRNWYDLERYIESELDPIKSDLQEAFNHWIENIEKPIDVNIEKIKINSTGTFLSFNYTDILETNYNIPRKNVTYLHNRINEGRDLLYGHAWNPGEWAEQRKGLMPEGLNEREQEEWREEQADNYHYSIERGYVAIDTFFSSIYKDCNENIVNHKTFFSNLSNIKTIYILGHSISEVDQPYYKKIIENIDVRKVKWFVSYHGGVHDFEEKKQVLIDLGISHSVIKPIQMTHMKRYKQLALPFSDN